MVAVLVMPLVHQLVGGIVDESVRGAVIRRGRTLDCTAGLSRMDVRVEDGQGGWCAAERTGSTCDR